MVAMGTASDQPLSPATWDDVVRWWKRETDSDDEKTTPENRPIIVYTPINGQIVGGNPLAALMLSELLHWFTPNKKGKPHKEGGVEKGGKWYVAIRQDDWIKRLGMGSRSTISRATKLMEGLNLIEVIELRTPYYEKKTGCYWLNVEEYTRRWQGVMRQNDTYQCVKMTHTNASKWHSDSTASQSAPLSEHSVLTDGVFREGADDQATHTPKKDTAKKKILEFTPPVPEPKSAEMVATGEQSLDPTPLSPSPTSGEGALATREMDETMLAYTAMLRRVTQTDSTALLKKCAEKLIEQGIRQEDLPALAAAWGETIHWKDKPDPPTAMQIAAYAAKWTAKKAEDAAAEAKYAALFEDFPHPPTPSPRAGEGEADKSEDTSMDMDTPRGTDSPDRVWESIRQAIKIRDMDEQEFSISLKNAEYVGWQGGMIYVRVGEYSAKVIQERFMDRIESRVNQLVNWWSVSFIVRDDELPEDLHKPS